MLAEAAGMARNEAEVNSLRSRGFLELSGTVRNGSWRKGRDSNPRWSHPHGGFQDRCLKPLGHPSKLGGTSTLLPWVGWPVNPQLLVRKATAAPLAERTPLYSGCLAVRTFGEQKSLLGRLGTQLASGLIFRRCLAPCRSLERRPRRLGRTGARRPTLSLSDWHGRAGVTR